MLMLSESITMTFISKSLFGSRLYGAIVLVLTNLF